MRVWLYALRIGEATPIFVEAKAGGADLKYFEKQLEDYCRAAKPKPVLAVLTNGSHWWLYLPPSLPPVIGIKEAEIKRFLEINVTTDGPVEIEENFRKFLARENVSGGRFISQTRNAAYQLFKEKQKVTAVTKGLADAWNKFAEDSQVKSVS